MQKHKISSLQGNFSWTYSISTICPRSSDPPLCSIMGLLYIIILSIYPFSLHYPLLYIYCISKNWCLYSIQSTCLLLYSNTDILYSIIPILVSLSHAKHIPTTIYPVRVISQYYALPSIIQPTLHYSSLYPTLCPRSSDSVQQHILSLHCTNFTHYPGIPQSWVVVVTTLPDISFIAGKILGHHNFLFLLIFPRHSSPIPEHIIVGTLVTEVPSTSHARAFSSKITRKVGIYPESFSTDLALSPVYHYVLPTLMNISY